MALLEPQQVTATGTAVTHAAGSTGGDTVRPDDRVALWVKNTNAATRDVTIVIPGTRFGQANPDVTVTVPATTGERLISLVGIPGDPSTGNVNLTYTPDPPTGLTVAAIRF